MSNDELGNTFEAEIVGTERVTPSSRDEVRQITLRIDDPAFRYVEGQSVGVVVEGPHPFGNRYHLRRYAIANDRGMGEDGMVELSILVRRCFYIDEVSGERYPGIASNYLCDRSVGDRITLTGPYRSPFKAPSDPSSNLVMVGTGTGVAPFRGFIKRIYREKGAWQGKVRLFYGAKNGMDLLYMNDINGDLTNYLDEQTFQAFNGIAGRPLGDDTAGLERSLDENAGEIWDLLQESNTYLFLAGLKPVAGAFDKKMSQLAGSEQAWERVKAKISAEGRLSELLYS
ncbi:MAG: oxidoreductase [Candidatus Sedimenticola endophacoides]|nr:MAG: oxidoreductase [Candidatus Sedimenticola endophacoides]PUE03894.1 MAG: oxidoreductase [Candidatus Sedimenticola endophacoides]PUE04523.1 MAG: oxidoreductase [Candidatus Sedimenticola endophacoides]